MIDSFSGEYAFLSNFHRSPVLFERTLYPTVEHAFQAAKTSDPKVRHEIAIAGTPSRAKQLGRKAKLRPDWESVKLLVMYHLLKQKFEHEELREKLLATGDEQLVEGNWWNDTFWGVCDGKGENNLGKLLMQVREEIRGER